MNPADQPRVPALRRQIGIWLRFGLMSAGNLVAQPSDGFPRSGGEMPIRLDPVLIFFPPAPPPLGRAIARTASAPARFVAPAELAAYINEPFYPPLSTRLITRTLNEKLRAQLERYRAAKVALQNELRAELDRVRDTEPSARMAELVAFSRKQTPKIVELEKSAEQLRSDLITRDYTWSALRQWRLGDHDRRGFSPLEIGQVMRGYAFYQNGLLPAQRRLLREISMELAAAGDTTANATAAQPYLFFPPEPARVLLPDDIPAEVAAKVAAYQTKKSKLKKELYDAVHQYDGQKLGFLRGNSLKTLAEKQAAALVELETLAEEIRRGLAQVVEPAAIAERTPLSPVLHERLATLLRNYAELQKETAQRIEAVLATAKDLPMQANYRFEGDGLKYLVIPTRGARGGRGGPGGAAGGSTDTLARVNDVHNQIAAIADDYGRRVADFINEKDVIRSAVEQAFGNAKAASVDHALLTAVRVVTAKETENSYREYRIAVFQPGLSPEQRRLFYDNVLERLELPLPRGEYQPIGRASSW